MKQKNVENILLFEIKQKDVFRKEMYIFPGGLKQGNVQAVKFQVGKCLFGFRDYKIKK